MGQLRILAQISYSDHLYTRAIGTPSPGLFIVGKGFGNLLDELIFENLLPELLTQRILRAGKRRNDIYPAASLEIV